MSHNQFIWWCINYTTAQIFGGHIEISENFSWASIQVQIDNSTSCRTYETGSSKVILSVGKRQRAAEEPNHSMCSQAIIQDVHSPLYLHSRYQGTHREACARPELQELIFILQFNLRHFTEKSWTAPNSRQMQASCAIKLPCCETGQNGHRYTRDLYQISVRYTSFVHRKLTRYDSWYCERFRPRLETFLSR
jgi:hypothetical protein